MSSGHDNEPGFYEIRVRGHLESRWAAWFDGMTLTRGSDGTTDIRGPVVDQAALHGLLHTVRDTGLPLVAVSRVERPRAEPPPSDPRSARGEVR
jgi:hypothetical protein